MFRDEEVVGNDFLDKVADVFRNMVEFVTMLNDVCMPDDDGDSEEDEEERGEEEEEEEEEDGAETL